MDVAAYPMFFDGTHTDNSGLTKQAYQELYAQKLLGFAIALRSMFYQGRDHQTTSPHVLACGFLDKWKEGEAVNTHLFTAKDICDKIIHANTISRYLEKDIPNPITYLRGSQFGTEWEQSISVSLFTEGILNWLQSQTE